MAKNKKSPKQKARDAAAKAARRHPKNETAAVIAMPKQESDDLLQAATAPADALSENNPAGTGATSNQAANDLTINMVDGSELSPVISYDLTGQESDIIDTADDPVEPEETKTNEERALEMAAAAAAVSIEDSFEVKFSEFCIYLRDNFSKALKTAHDGVIRGWINFGAFIERRIDALYTWADAQNQVFAAKWASWFPKKDYVTTEALNDILRDNFAELAEILGGSYKEQSDTNIRLAKQIAALTKAVLGEPMPRTVSADKLDDYTAALLKGEKTKAASMYAALTGSTLAVAKSAVSAELVN